MTILSIPADAAFHESVSEEVAAWKAADALVKKLTSEERVARDELRAAPERDAVALRDAVLAGEAPPDKVHTAAAEKKLADVILALPVANAELERASEALAVALRDDEARGTLAGYASDHVGAALEAYTDALADAERRVSEATRTLASASAVLRFIDGIDRGLSRTAMVEERLPSVDFSAASRAADRLSTAVEALSSRAMPESRRIRYTGNEADGTDGRVVSVPRTLAAEHARDGLVAEWLDGHPPEEPAAPVGGGRHVKGGVLSLR